MRLHAQTATIENGFVHLPETAHWLADYLHELTMFPAGRYDDQVDFDSAGVCLDDDSTARVGMERILSPTTRTGEWNRIVTVSLAESAGGA